jgi:hypothetical protein
MQLRRSDVILLVILALIGCAKSNELILQCKGNVSGFMPTLRSKDDEMIGVHVRNGMITFSGNDFLLGNNITVCPPGTLGIPVDTLYFDSSGCSGRSEIGTPRQYGTLNTIIMKLDLTNTGDRLGITGRFHCSKVS